MELVGILTTHKDAFLKAVDTPSLSSVVVVMADARDIDVRIFLLHFIRSMAVTGSANCLRFFSFIFYFVGCIP